MTKGELIKDGDYVVVRGADFLAQVTLRTGNCEPQLHIVHYVEPELGVRFTARMITTELKTYRTVADPLRVTVQCADGCASNKFERSKDKPDVAGRSGGWGQVMVE